MPAVEEDDNGSFSLVEQRHEVCGDGATDDLRLWTVHRHGVGQLHEGDLHLRSLSVQLPLEVLASVRPPVREVVGDPVRPHCIENASELPVSVGAIDRHLSDHRRLRLPLPEIGPDSCGGNDGAVEAGPVFQVDGLRLDWVVN